MICTKGELACIPCNKSGTLLAVCEDCAGTGAWHNPVDMPVSTCPWCLDTTVRDCGACDEQGKFEQPCARCADHGSLACTTCRGLRKLVCKQCGGRGRFGSQKKKCKDCRTKGFTKCTSCKKGAVKCGSCVDASRTACNHCSGTQQHDCNGCASGAYLAWEQTARWFLDQGSPEPAEQWLAVARTRCQERYGKLMTKLEKSMANDDLAAEFMLATQSELDTELRRLDILRGQIAGVGK